MFAISSRTRPVTHLAGPPTARVPLRIYPEGQPTSLGREEGPAATVPRRREREEREVEG